MHNLLQSLFSPAHTQEFVMSDVLHRVGSAAKCGLRALMQNNPLRGGRAKWKLRFLCTIAACFAAAAFADPGRMIRAEATVKAPVAEVWQAWTTSAGAETFFAPKANIQLALGRPYEIYFDPKDERKGTKGLKILSYAPEEMISFQWNAPPEMPEVRDRGTGSWSNFSR
jgi:hypothetical protein